MEAQTAIDQFKPITLVSYVLSGARLFDPRDPANHAQYAVTPELLEADWYSNAVTGTPAPTWQLAARLAGEGYSGLSYASMHNGLENVVL